MPSPLTKFNVLTTRPRDNENGLVGWWTFDDGTATDWSGNQINGTIVGSVPTVAGPIAGNAVSFSNNASNRISLGAPASLKFTSGSSFSVSAWVYVTGANSTNVIIDYGSTNPTVNGGWAFYVDFTSGAYHLNWARSTIANIGTGVVMSGNAWHHVVGTNIVGTSVALYVDGVLGLSTAFTRTYDYLSTLNIGYGQGETASAPMNGMIDDLRVYNRLLSAAEINAIYNQGRAYQQGSPEGEMDALYLAPWGWLSEESFRPRRFFGYASFLDAPLAPPVAATIIRATDGGWDARRSTPTPDRAFSPFVPSIARAVAPPQAATDPLPIPRRPPPDWASVPVAYTIVSGIAWSRAWESPAAARPIDLGALVSPPPPTPQQTISWAVAFDVRRSERQPDAPFATLLIPTQQITLGWSRSWEVSAQAPPADVRSPTFTVPVLAPTLPTGWRASWDITRQTTSIVDRGTYSRAWIITLRLRRILTVVTGI